MIENQAEKLPAESSVAIDEEEPGGVPADPTAEEGTLALPPVRTRWRRDLREDIAPEVYAAFLYLRGLVAGDGRAHKAIAEAMGISPAEFTKRFSLSRENFPPWSSIAPVFDVLDRDPEPFLEQWGRLWAAPWATATLTYRGESDRFPELADEPAASQPDDHPDASELEPPPESRGPLEAADPDAEDTEPEATGSKVPMGLETSGFLLAALPPSDALATSGRELAGLAPTPDPAGTQTSVVDLSEPDDPATGPIPGIPVPRFAPSRRSVQTPLGPPASPTLMGGPTPGVPEPMVPAPRRPLEAAGVGGGVTEVLAQHVDGALGDWRARHQGLLGHRSRTAIAGCLIAAIALAATVVLATRHTPPPPPPPAAASWGAVVRDAGEDGVTLRSSPAVAGDTALGKIPEGANVRVECGVSAAQVFDNASPVAHTSTVWLRTQQHQFLSSLYLYIAGKSTILNCQPGLPDLPLIPEVAQSTTTAPAPATSHSATAAPATKTRSHPTSTTPASDSSTSNEQAAGGGSGQSSGADVGQSDNGTGSGASSQCQPGYVPTSSHGCG